MFYVWEPDERLRLVDVPNVREGCVPHHVVASDAVTVRVKVHKFTRRVIVGLSRIKPDGKFFFPDKRLRSAHWPPGETFLSRLALERIHYAT